jgi:hypothetical protein
MHDIDLFLILAVIGLAAFMLRGQFRGGRREGNAELARIRLLSERMHQEDAIYFE